MKPMCFQVYSLVMLISSVGEGFQSTCLMGFVIIICNSDVLLPISSFCLMFVCVHV